MADAVPAPLTQAPARAGTRAPFASVVVVAYASRAHIFECLGALAAQTFRDFEVVVFDNASPDGGLTSEELKAFDLPDARLIRSAENLGFAGGNNRAAEIARGRWLITLNPDAFPAPDWLDQLARASRDWPEFRLFGSKQVDAWNPAILDGSGDCYHAIGIAWRGLYDQPARDAPPTGEVFAPCAAAAMYLRAMFLEVGGFDERFFCYHEDVDLAFRLRLRGERCLQVQEAVVRHIGSASTGRRSDFAIYHGFRNRAWTFVKNMPLQGLILLGPVHAMATLYLLARLYFRNAPEARAARMGVWDALVGMGPFWRGRSHTLGHRQIPLTALFSSFTWRLDKLTGREHDVRPVDRPPASDAP